MTLLQGEGMLFDEDYGILADLNRFQDAHFSQLFVEQLQVILNERGIASEILIEIAALEGQGSSYTKPEKQFRHLPLKGLWHKHFLFGEFIAENIRNHLLTRTGGTEKLEHIVNQVLSSQKSQKEMTRDLARQIVEGSYEERANNQKITGEWIVFAKYNKQNYYLTLAAHGEKDEVIYQRVFQDCASKFPFLFDGFNGD